ncbi:TniQ protein [Mesorhizobium australicum]|uniref:TniQ protein n=2 Tax=Mesorhizobium australicum TaxID=536018 RepID=A0A1X7MQ84_9HYPH|nr:TniQ protein [Mesorhizobium australicum]SMH26511.1 TniQ protein [Mesorhizobium australicum]SMH26610.1 TniQ protein [Mesorhizobium australicum]
MGPGRLPMAPRPRRDELLSSWMARVACRYGLTAEELAGHFAGDGNSFSTPTPTPTTIDDRAPTVDQAQAWARACGVDPERLQRLSLSWRYPLRARAWYVSRGPEWTPSIVTGSTPVCLACFAADQSAGRDGYLRAGWMLAERCICPTHGELLLDRCLSCHRRLSVAFRLLDGRARPVCSSCGVILADRGGECDRHDRNLMRWTLAVQQRITASVDHENPARGQFEKALAMLWAPLDHPAAARPVLALWFNEAGWRCPYDVRHAVGADAPVGQLPARWRFLTLLALNDIFGADPRVDGTSPPAAAHLVRRAAPRRERLSRSSRRPHVQLQKRSSAEYERLARQILADPRWIAAEKLPRRKRERVRAGLIDAALAGNAAALGARLSPRPRSDGQAIQIS